jgi:class 3 adenylate cyclase
LLALFDGPTRATRCARAVQSDAREIGLTLRAGIHTGEVERSNGGVRGIAVHLAARIAALARPGELLVSSTINDLVAGAGIPFEDRGLHTLKGIHEPRRLFGISGTYGTTQKANRSGVIAEHWPSPAALPPTCSAISPGGAIRSRSKGNREGR